MDNCLTIADFQYIVISADEDRGYYSFKEQGFEICLDYNSFKGWRICLCNKYEEVVKEEPCSCQIDALLKANGYYKKYVTCQKYVIR